MSRRRRLTRWLEAGLVAVEPERLTRQALGARSGVATVIAIGKAAPGMCRGAARAYDQVAGICVSDHDEGLPEGIELIIGDHPVPGESSLEAGHRVLELAGEADIALISGGGSALCEVPREGLDLEYVARVGRSLQMGGADIVEINLVRGSLSRIKCGGLGPLPTYVLSDVGAAGPEFVASGPTIPMTPDPQRALEVLRRHHIEIHPELARILAEPQETTSAPRVSVIGDGRTAAEAVVAAAHRDGEAGRVHDGWLEGPAYRLVDEAIAAAPSGITVIAGETTVAHRDGRGGRNTHAALLAASAIADTGTLFAALATDGVDGSARAAGAIVDGATLTRGGDPTAALASFDSATYLQRTGDLIPGGPTGTNVADLWVIWKPDR